jgi:hypothetical protein
MPLSRRAFSVSLAAGLLSAADLAKGGQAPPRKKLAILTTEWRYHSHAWHMAERFLVGYPRFGQWHRPPFDVVSAYVDQFPENDLSRDRAREFGFTIYPSVAEALRLGGPRIAVDAVLLIGEHGNYPDNEFGQRQYPRYQLFEQVVRVCDQDQRVVPLFNDKHLSWKWEWAQAMVSMARERGMPLAAGSSLPVTWRMPAVDLPYGAKVNEAMCVAMGGVDSYDFHALEVIQCMVERRQGGETGVARLEAIRGEEVWKRMETSSWSEGGWNPQLFSACLSRSQTLAQTPTGNHRYPTPTQIREWVKDPVVYRFEYNDGLRASMLLLNGLVGDFTFAAQIDGAADPLSTLFYLPPVPNVAYSAPLMAHAEETFLQGKAPYPIERTLLTGGLVEAGCQSLKRGNGWTSTPHLAVQYRSPNQSFFENR